MLIIKTQEEAEKHVKDGVFRYNGDVKFECDVVLGADITAGNIYARNINAGNIDAGDINARNIEAGNIYARNINAGYISALDISALDISAWDINAGYITAGNIRYYAVCIAHSSFKCKSLKGLRDNHIAKCLDGEIEYIKDERTVEDVLAELGEADKEIMRKAMNQG